jgi:hypothetical protein
VLKKYDSQIVIIFFSTLFFLQYPGLIRGEFFGSIDLAQYYYPWTISFPANYPGRSYLSWSDQMDQSFPPISFIRQSILNFDIPFYTNFSQNGIPYFLVSKHEVFTPVLATLTIIFNSVIGNSFYIYFKYIIGAVSIYKIGQHWKLTKYGSLVASTVFTLNSYSIANLQGPLGTIYLLTPALIFCIMKLFDEPDWKYAFLVPIWSLWIFTAGYPPAIAFIVMFLAYFIIVNYFNSAIKKLNKKMIAFSTLSTTVILTPFFLETYNYLFQSVDLDYRINKWNNGIDLSRLKTNIYPWFFGEQGFLTTATYFGVIGLFLFILGFISSFENRRLNALKIYTVFIFGILYFEDFRRIFYRYIPFANLSNANNQILIYSFLFSLIAGIGADQLINKKLNPIKLISSLSLILVAGTYITVSSRGLLELSSISRFYLIIVAISFMLFMIYKFNSQQYSFLNIRVLPILFVILITLDLHSFARNYTWTVPKDFVYPKSPIIEFLKKNQKDQKIIALGTNLLPDTYLWHSLRVVGGRGFFSENVNNLYKELDPEVDTHPTQKFFTASSFDVDSYLLNVMGVKYIVSAPLNKQQKGIDLIESDDLELVYSGLDGTVYSLPVINGPIQLVSDINCSRLSNRIDKNLLEDSAQCGLPILKVASGQSNKSTIKIEDKKNSSLKIVTSTVEKTKLLIGDNYNSSWVARINGKQVPVQQELKYFMSIDVPVGENEITLKYRPTAFYILPISTIFLLLNLTLLLFSRFKSIAPSFIIRGLGKSQRQNYIP